MKKLFNAENYMKTAERQKIEKQKRDQLREFQKKERERLNLAVKALREEREHKIVQEDHLEKQKNEVMIKHRKLHARKLVALSESNTALSTSKSNGRRRSGTLSSNSNGTVSSEADEEDFAYTFLRNARLPKIEKEIDNATINKLLPVKNPSFLQVLQNW